MKELLKKLKQLLKDINKAIKRIKEALRKPLKYIEDTKLSGIGILALLAGQFLYSWKVYSVFRQVPSHALIIGSIAAVIGINELFNLVVRLIFKKDFRVVTYFISAFALLTYNNILGNHRHLLYPSIITCLFITLSFYLLATSIYNIIKNKLYKNIKNYIFIGIVLLCSAFSIYFLTSDYFLSKKENITVEEELPKGNHEVVQFKYASLPMDLSSIVKTKGLESKLANKISKYNYKNTPIFGVVYTPVDLNNTKTLFIVHGATDRCNKSYLGFNYLGEYLASFGYTVISIDENIVNELGGKNDIRTIILLENIKYVLKENQREGSDLYQKIDASSIALAGHSRGGEVISLAYIFNELENHPEYKDYKFDYHFNISSLIAIAPTVDQYLIDDKSLTLENVNYLLLAGSNDGDVSKAMGEKQYNNISFTKNNYFKTSLYIKGANHGLFNSKWNKYDMTKGANHFINVSKILDRSYQETITKMYIKTFLDCTLNNDNTSKDLFINNSKYLKYLPNTKYYSEYLDSSYKLLENFDNNKTNIKAKNTTNNKIHPDNMGNGKDKENQVLDLSWNKNNNAYIYLNTKNISINELSFRVADMRKIKKGDNLNIKIELIDSNKDKTSITKRLELPLAIKLYKEDILYKSYEYKNPYYTIFLKKSDFSNKEFDYKNVSKIKIYLDDNTSGRIIIDDLYYK